jgi:hypothetical protein
VGYKGQKGKKANKKVKNKKIFIFGRAAFSLRRLISFLRAWKALIPVGA